MSDNKMSDELQIAIRRSPEYTAPSAELVALRAEVAGWRRAVRWYTIGDWRAELRVKGIGAYSHELGAVSQYPGGWTVEVHGAYKTGIQTDRNAACAKVCKLLGIPVVLPGGGGE